MVEYEDTQTTETEKWAKEQDHIKKKISFSRDVCYDN